MSEFDYVRSAATGDRLLVCFGAVATIHRHETPTVPPVGAPRRPWDPHLSDGNSGLQVLVGQTFAVRLEYYSREVDGTNILSSDSKIYTSAAPGRAVPTVGDSMVLSDGSSYEVLACDPLAPAGVPVVYVVQGRS